MAGEGAGEISTGGIAAVASFSVPDAKVEERTAGMDHSSSLEVRVKLPEKSGRGDPVHEQLSREQLFCGKFLRRKLRVIPAQPAADVREIRLLDPHAGLFPIDHPVVRQHAVRV